MLRIIKVTGESLLPDYKEGDYVVIITFPFFFDSLKSGDTIVFRHPVYGTMVKCVERVNAHHEEIFVIGNHPHSVDSRQFGPIPKGWITGKVLWHIAKPG
jgi:nickel-type superoxide dismutase maturation protease